MHELERSKQIIEGTLDCNRTWNVTFEYNRDYEKSLYLGKKTNNC